MPKYTKEELTEIVARETTDNLSTKLKELEIHRKYKNELVLKENQLDEVRKRYDELLYSLEENMKRKSLLEFQMTRSQFNIREPALESTVEKIHMEIGDIKEEWVLHNFQKEQLKHISDRYKADILIMQDRIQKSKEEIKRQKTKNLLLEKKMNSYNKRLNYLSDNIVRIDNLYRENKMKV